MGRAFVSWILGIGGSPRFTIMSTPAETRRVTIPIMGRRIRGQHKIAPKRTTPPDKGNSLQGGARYRAGTMAETPHPAPRRSAA